MRKLPTLETLRVTSPCQVPWDRMTGDARIRHCDVCKQNVYNLSEMTRAEANDLIDATGARMCMRYYHRADGTILLRDCAVEYRPTSLIAAGAVALALSGAALWHARVQENGRHHEVARPAAIIEVLPPPTVAPPPSIPPQEQGYITGGLPPRPIDNEPTHGR
jgi:hypothetical protein